MSDGFFLMHRGWRDNPVFRGEFSRADAWVWLIENACWKPTRFDISGKTVTLNRGQFCTSMRELAGVWGWSKSTVERFLTRLKTETMIGTDSGTGRLIITICNYTKYQDVTEKAGTADGTPDGTAAGQQRDIKEQGNKGTIEVEEAKASPTKRDRAAKPDEFPCPDGCDPIDWASLLKTREKSRKSMTAGAYRQILNKLEGWARDGWPPGPILAHAVERGWLTVFPTDTMKFSTNDRSSANQSGPTARRNAGTRPDGVGAAFHRRIAAERSRDDPSDVDQGAGAAGELPLAPARIVHRG